MKSSKEILEILNAGGHVFLSEKRSQGISALTTEIVEANGERHPAGIKTICYLLADHPCRVDKKETKHLMTAKFYLSKPNNIQQNYPMQGEA